MHVAITSSIVSVLGSGFLGLLFFQFKSQRDLTTQGFAAQSQQTERLFAVVKSHGDTLKAHGERLARIEAKLELLIPDPPANAADRPEAPNPPDDIDPPGSAEAA